GRALQRPEISPAGSWGRSPLAGADPDRIPRRAAIERDELRPFRTAFPRLCDATEEKGVLTMSSPAPRCPPRRPDVLPGALGRPLRLLEEDQPPQTPRHLPPPVRLTGLRRSTSCERGSPGSEPIHPWRAAGTHGPQPAPPALG